MTDQTATPKLNARFEDLKAVFINTSLKPNKSDSHTATLMQASADIMRKHGVDVEFIHAVDHQIAFGIYPDMTEKGAERDDWPKLWPKVDAADILVIGTPIWLGEESSICRMIIERLYAMSGMLNDKNQSIFYNKVGGAVVTGNEDGVKHSSMTILYALSHLGLVVPPQADTGWIGEVGPGPSFGDEKEDGTRVGFDSDFTRNNTIIMTWNLLHMARMIKDAGGIPSYGNDREALKAGETFGHHYPGSNK